MKAEHTDMSGLYLSAAEDSIICVLQHGSKMPSASLSHPARRGEHEKLLFFFIPEDGRFHFQFALPWLGVVLRTDSGGLFCGDDRLVLALTAGAAFGPQPRNTRLIQNRKCCRRLSKKTET